MNPLDIVGFRPSVEYLKSVSEKLTAFNNPPPNTIDRPKSAPKTTADKPADKVAPKNEVLNEVVEMPIQVDPAEYIKSISDKLVKLATANSNTLNEAGIHETIDADGRYKVYRDKDETFECNVSVEGTSLSTATARLVFVSDTWNIFFDGTISNGKCTIPLKKMVIFEEGVTGEARLEIVIDDALFIPWKEQFIVEKPKKVEIAVKAVKSISIS